MNCKPRDIVVRRIAYRGCPIEAAHRLADHLLPEIERRWGTDAADLQPIAIDIPSNNSLSQQTTTAFVTIRARRWNGVLVESFSEYPYALEGKFLQWDVARGEAHHLMNRAKQYAWSLDQQRGECGAESCPYCYGTRRTQSQIKRELSAQDIAERAKRPRANGASSHTAPEQNSHSQQSSRPGRSVAETDDDIEAQLEASEGGSIHQTDSTDNHCSPLPGC